MPKQSYFKPTPTTSTSIEEFNVAMQEFKAFSLPAYEWLLKIPPQHWARSHFSGKCKSDMLVNNMCEVFNGKMLGGRDKAIISTLEFAREYLMKFLMYHLFCYHLSINHKLADHRKQEGSLRHNSRTCTGPRNPQSQTGKRKTRTAGEDDMSGTQTTAASQRGTRSDYAATDKGKGVAVDDGSNKKKCQPRKKIINIR
ncbi:hypothetical protein Tco_1384462 [Tanacetum coccineum]